ncbi:MAG: Gfo/Idh/MocA family oxidoreductase [Planctomycetales bacterium]
MKLRIGLVGLGPEWENRYRLALRVLSDRFTVKAVYDQVAHRARQAAREFECDAADGFRSLAAREDVDALLLLSPQWFGSLPILAACDAQRSVYCAAPLEHDLEEIRRIKERVDHSGVAFVTESIRRFAPAAVRLKELIATRLGPPRLLFCHLRQEASQPNPRRLPADSLTNQSRRSELVELVDWCRFVVGSDPSSVVGALNVCEETGNEDYAMMSLDFSGDRPAGTGPMAQISCGRYVPPGWEEAASFRPPAGLQVACENGIAFVDLPSHLIWFDDAGRHLESLETERPVDEQLLSHFHRAVTSLVRRSSAVDDLYLAAQIVDAARRSHQEGKRIRLHS